MKSEPDPTHPIWGTWLAGKAAVGALKPHSVLTVEPGWTLRTTNVAGSRSPNKLPIRYFQRADNCVDIATEILTRRGWLRMDELRIGDQTLAIDSGRDGAVWSEVTAVNICEARTRKMLRLGAQNHSSLTTMGHRWLVRSAHRGKRSAGKGFWRWKTSGELATRDCIPTAMKPLHAPSEAQYEDAFVRLVGWWFTEGSSADISQSASAHPANCDEIRGLLRRLYGEPGPMRLGPHLPPEIVKEAEALRAAGFTYQAIGERLGHSSGVMWKVIARGSRPSPQWNEKVAASGTTIFAVSLQVRRDLERACEPNTKALRPGFLCALTEAQLGILLQTCMAGDGCWADYIQAEYPRRVGATNRRSDVFGQLAGVRAESFQMLCCLAGVATHQRAAPRTSTGNEMVAMTLYRLKVCRPVANYRNTARPYGAAICETVMHDGIVWCPTTTAGTWLARRDGKVFFTGNSQQEIVIPGVRHIEAVYDIDQDADTLNVTLVNNSFDPDYGAAEWANVNGDFGAPGFLSPERGALTNRWGYIPNEWAGLLTKNALLRLYWGMGGAGKTLAQAISDGNLVLDGVWMVDDVPRSTGQGFQLQARNMAKLLIDQTIFPPLVPAGDYPMHRARFFQTLASSPIVVYGHLAVNPRDRVLRMDRPVDSDGYWLAGTDGGVYSYGHAAFYGSIDTTGTTVTPGAYPNVGVSSMAASPDGGGYVLASSSGAAFAFGSAPYHGGLSFGPSPPHPIVAIEWAGPLDGYFMFGDDGGAFAFGAASFHGSLPPLVPGHRITDAAVTPTGLGYWMVDDGGRVYAYGDAPYLGGLTSAAHPVVAIAPTPDGRGYYLLGNDGGVFAFGDAPFYGSAAAITLNDPMSDMVVSVDGTGYWLCAEDGGVFTFMSVDSTVHFYGSMPGGESDEFVSDGNYLDFTNVIEDLALYSGFHLYDGGATDGCYGVLETTGVYSPDQAGGILDAVFFDKQPVADVMKKLRDVVGWLLTVDHLGGLRFHEPNVFESGNFFNDFSHTLTVPVVDERVNLVSWQVNTPDKDEVSEIIVSSADPDAGITGISTTTFTPASAVDLRGMVKPGMRLNLVFTDPVDQETMAQLIALQISFKSRLGSAKMLACPMIEKGDQLQIVERETAEVNTHYVRRIVRSHDRKTGEFTDELTTNILSPPGAWAVVKPEGTPSGSVVTNRVI